MTAYDKILWATAVSNTLLWGGILFGFIWLSVTDPRVPDDTKPAEPATQAAGLEVARTDGAPRHRA